jgi:hypothetical protein
MCCLWFMCFACVGTVLALLFGPIASAVITGMILLVVFILYLVTKLFP